MSAWFSNHLWQILCIVAALIIVGFSRPLVDRVKDHKVLLWFAFVVYLGCGLALGAGLFAVVRWATGLSGTFGGLVSSIGAILGIIGGWWGFSLTAKAARDLGDGVPDNEARRAALLVPTLAPACFAAAWSIVRHPSGIGTGITAAVIAGISLLFLFGISKSVLKAQKHPLFWKWFAVAVHVLAGLLMIPLLAYIDAQIANHLGPDWSLAFRVTVGAMGIGLLIAGIADVWPKKDKGETKPVPDKWVRGFASLGVPALVLSGALAVGFVVDHGADQANLIVSGSVK
jgi:hypothetical protein